MKKDSDAEDEDVMLMISPTTGKVLLILPTNLLGFSNLDMARQFVCDLKTEVDAIGKALGDDQPSSIADDYSALVISEWEEVLNNPERPTEDASE